MSKVKSRAKFDITRSIGPAFGKAFKEKMGQLIISEMKNDISKGNSPVREEGRFARYKDVKKYPAGQKPNRPVNLDLTGEMLSYLSYEILDSKSGVVAGILNAPDEVQQRALAHLKGTRHMAQRKFLPFKQGDQLTVRIQRRMLAFYNEQMKRLIAKTNR